MNDYERSVVTGRTVLFGAFLGLVSYGISAHLIKGFISDIETVAAVVLGGAITWFSMFVCYRMGRAGIRSDDASVAIGFLGYILVIAVSVALAIFATHKPGFR